MAKKARPEYECTLTSWLVAQGTSVVEADIPRPEGKGWRLVSHTASVCSWHYGDYGSVLLTYSWEREVTQ